MLKVLLLILLFSVPVFGQGDRGIRPWPSPKPVSKQTPAYTPTPVPPSALAQFWGNRINRRDTFIAIGAVGVFLLILWLSTSKKDNRNVVDKTEALVTKSSIDDGIVAAKVETKRSQARGERNAALAGEAHSQVTLSNATTQAEIEHLTAPKQVKIAQLEVDERLIKQETTTSYSSQLAQIDHKGRLAIKENALIVTESASAMGLSEASYSEVKKVMELERIRLEARWNEREQDLRAAYLFEQSEYQKLELLLKHIKSLYDTADNEEGRAKELTEEHIKFLEDHFRARKGLLQTNARTNLSGGDEGSNGGRSNREAVDEASD